MLPQLDLFGGHTAVTAHSPETAVYHYHLSLQTSSAPTSAGTQAWFVTTGKLRGSLLPCPTCG